MRNCLAVLAFLIVLSGPAAAVTAGTAPDPTTLLITPADLPSGYVSDDALENADATARSRAYSNLIAASAFAGYRTDRAALVQYVARLHRRADVATFLAGEGAAVDRSHEALRLTLAATYGDAANLAYQARGSHGEEWAVVIFADGPYVAMLGAYQAAAEQAAIDVLQRLAALVDRRLRAAAVLAPDTAPLPAALPGPQPALRIVSFYTATVSGRSSDLFKPHSTVYWRVVWHVRRVSARDHEALHEVVWIGKRILYSNGLTDRPYSGDNALVDHLHLSGATSGVYTITVTIAIGRASVKAAHAFHVIAAPPKPLATSSSKIARGTGSVRNRSRQCSSACRPFVI